MRRAPRATHYPRCDGSDPRTTVPMSRVFYLRENTHETQIRRILVAIGDLRHAPKNELRKAATLARKSSASIELFHAITEPDPGRSYTKTATATAVAQRRTTTATKRQHSLQRMARDPSLRGLEVTCTASWDFPPHEAIVRRAHSTRADLVIAATRRHRLWARLLLTNTDWELIRQCPVPVLLVKSRRPYKNPVVVAAVDPFHSHADPPISTQSCSIREQTSPSCCEAQSTCFIPTCHS